MKLARYDHDGTVTCGVLHETDGDAPRLRALPDGQTIDGLLRLGLDQALVIAAAAAAGSAVPLSDVRLLPPVDPTSVRDFLAFEEHNQGMVAGRGGTLEEEWYEAPTFYFGNPANFIGAHDDVLTPPGSELLDYEIEVAAVIGAVEGEPGASLSVEDAGAHIFGYTIFGDWSARDLQRREMRVGLGPAKGKDSAVTVGPWLVTADELAPHLDDEGFLHLDLEVTVNGVRTGHDVLQNMAWTFPEIVSYASRGTLVRPGDVLASGTCGNGGCLAELWGRSKRTDPPSLQPGDVVEMTVEHIGVLRNTVVPGLTASPVPRARARDYAAVRGA